MTSSSSNDTTRYHIVSFEDDLEVVLREKKEEFVHVDEIGKFLASQGGSPMKIAIIFDPVDAGDSANIPNIETALGILWRILSPQFGCEFTLRVLRRV